MFFNGTRYFVTPNATLPTPLLYQSIRARISIADSKGSIIKHISIAGAGNGNLKVDVAGFSSGTYTYSLLIDGKTMGSKQMIVAK